MGDQSDSQIWKSQMSYRHETISGFKLFKVCVFSIQFWQKCLTLNNLKPLISSRTILGIFALGLDLDLARIFLSQVRF